MPDALLACIVLLLCGPLALIALTPLWSALLVLIGRRHEAQIGGISIARAAAAGADSGRWAVVHIRLRLEIAGQAGVYEVSRIVSPGDRSVIEASVGRTVSVYMLRTLSERLGWNSMTLRVGSPLFRPGIMILVPFWFLGVLPLVATLWWLVTDGNLLFDLVRLIARTS